MKDAILDRNRRTRYTKRYHQWTVNVIIPTPKSTNIVPTSWIIPYSNLKYGLGHHKFSMGLIEANFSTSPSGTHICRPTKEINVV